MAEGRLTMRMAGLLKARLPDVGLEQVEDPRRRQGRRWELPALLTAMVVGMAAGRKSLKETEKLTEEVSSALRRSLKIRRRTPDTTLRNAAEAMSPAEVRASLRRQVKAAWRRKALSPTGLPFGVDDEGRSARVVDVWRSTGIERARQGVPLEAVLSAYTTGNLLLWEAMTERVRDGRADVTAEELVAAGRRLWRDLGIQGEVMSEAYRREMARRELRDLRRQENYLAGLLEGRASDPDFAAQAEEILGIRPDVPVACVVAVLEDTHSEPLQHPEDRVERMGGTSRWGVRDGALYGVVTFQGVDESWLRDVLRPTETTP